MKYFYRRFSLFISLIVLASLVGCSSSASTDSVGKNNTVAKKQSSTVIKDTNTTAKAEKEKETAAVAEKNVTLPSNAGDQTKVKTSSQPEQKVSDQAAQTVPVAPKANTTTIVSSEKPTVAASASQSAPAKQPTTATVPQAAPTPAQTVTFSIAGPKEDHSADRQASTVKITNGESLLDVLLGAVGKGNVDYSGSGATAYVSGIHNIYEFDYGAKSGWVFKLNGVSLTKSIGVVSVKNGDRIECLYTE